MIKTMIITDQNWIIIRSQEEALKGKSCEGFPHAITVIAHLTPLNFIPMHRKIGNLRKIFCH